MFTILQGIGIGTGSATERWPSQKLREIDLFFWGEKNYLKKIFSSYAKILGETNFHAWEIPQSG